MKVALQESSWYNEELIHILSYPRIAERLRLDEDELVAILAGLLSNGRTMAAGGDEAGH